MSQLENYLNSTELVKRLWTMDLEQAQRFSEQLLNTAEAENNLYQCAIANLYLLYYNLTQKDYGACRFYLLRAQALCQENDFDDL